MLFQGIERKDVGDEYGGLIKRAMLEDPNEQVRWWAAFALARGRYTTQENAQAMYKALDDTSDAVQNRAATSLKGMM